MGCGDAHLLAYLAQTLPARHPDRSFDFFGFEVGDIGWQADGYVAETLDYLEQHVPLLDWAGHISLFSAQAHWPYPPASFEIVLSNQVLEHVQDHPLVFSEIHRCLAPQGFSVHLFPLKETIYEVHAHMPIVHWIAEPARRSKVMSRFAKLGFRRKYIEEMHFRGWKSLDQFGDIYSDVLETMTNYKTSGQILEMAKQAGFQADFHYTKEFLRTKLLSLFGRTPEIYATPNLVDDASLPLLKRLASVTLTLRSSSQPS
jgi:ubiquinone/menaquinone biosynthesis C-methylase UbiE